MESYIYPIAILAIFVIVVVCKEILSHSSDMEKKVTDYFSYAGFEWKKEEGVLMVKRSGIIFHIFLRKEERLPSTSLWIQYVTQLDDDQSKMHWAGQTVLVNTLNHQHPSLNVSMDTEDNVLWVHYRADIRSQNEFAFHFNNAYSEMQSLVNDYREMLPKLQADFPAGKNKNNKIGFA